MRIPSRAFLSSAARRREILGKQKNSYPHLLVSDWKHLFGVKSFSDLGSVVVPVAELKKPLIYYPGSKYARQRPFRRQSRKSIPLMLQSLALHPRINGRSQTKKRKKLHPKQVFFLRPPDRR